MLHDFTYYNPTKIYFGKDSMQNPLQNLRITAKIFCFYTAKTQSRKLAFMTKLLRY